METRWWRRELASLSSEMWYSMWIGLREEGNVIWSGFVWTMLNADPKWFCIKLYETDAGMDGKFAIVCERWVLLSPAAGTYSLIFPVWLLLGNKLHLVAFAAWKYYQSPAKISHCLYILLVYARGEWRYVNVICGVWKQLAVALAALASFPHLQLLIMCTSLSTPLADSLGSGYNIPFFFVPKLI